MLKNKKYQKPTILQVLPALSSGGVERGTLEISKYINKNGFNVIVASNGGTLVNELYNLDIKHIALPLHSKNPLTILKNQKEIENIINYYEVDLVHARSRAPAWSAYRAAKNSSIKFVTTFHGIYNFSNRIKKYYNSVMTRGDKVIATSNFTRDHILKNYKIDDNKISVIHRGVDLAVFDPDAVNYNRISNAINKYSIPDDKVVMLLPSRFARWKGQKFVIDAIKEIKDKNYYFIMVGDKSKHPDYVKGLEKTLAKFGLEDNIKLFDAATDISALYYLCDFVIFPSIEPESFGRIAIEAQAMGKTILASDHGGCVETIIDGETGYLFENNKMEDFKEKFLKLLDLSENDKEAMATKAISNVRNNFSLDKMCQKTVDVYNEVLGKLDV